MLTGRLAVVFIVALLFGRLEPVSAQYFWSQPCPPSECPPIRIGGDYPGSNYGSYGGGGGLTTIYIDGRPAWRCEGDCNGDGLVDIDELMLCIDIAMGTAPADSCPSPSAGALTISSLTNAVANSLTGSCR
jgi:hypothetical protein